MLVMLAVRWRGPPRQQTANRTEILLMMDSGPVRNM